MFDSKKAMGVAMAVAAAGMLGASSTCVCSGRR